VHHMLDSLDEICVAKEAMLCPFMMDLSNLFVAGGCKCKSRLK
jgi:hypothetical protein